MIKKTNVLLVALMATMSVEAARSATYAEKVYVDSRDTTLINRMKTQDSRLAMIRDWVNPQDEAGNRAVLATQAQDAYRAINELKSTLEAAIAGKQEKGDYLVAEDLKDLQDAVSALDSGKADVSTVTALQETIGKLGETYATKADMTDEDNALKASIDALDKALKAINLSEYAKSADVALTYATKSEIPSIEGLAEKSYVDEELAKKASAETVQNITNNYLSKTDAQNTYVTEQQVTQQITNVVGDDTTGLRKQVADNVAAIAENKAAIAGKADKSALETAVSDLNTKIDQAVIDSSNIDLGSYAKTEDVAKTYATIATVDAELDKKANVADLKALAYKDTVATADIEPKAVTMDKIAGRTPVAGETLLMSVDAEGNVTWLSVEILK